MSYLDGQVHEKLRSIVGPANVSSAPEDLQNYAHDELPGVVFLPEAVVKPANTEEVAAVMRLANEVPFPVTPRGLGTGLSGGALAVQGGIVLSLERMNKILEIDEANLMAVVQPGVITGELQKEVEARGLFYPVDPASLDSCSIGGNIAENAGGPRAVKYGITRDYVTGLEAVLPEGEIVRYGGKVVKNVVGYDLANLLIGSEGTLGIITEITLKLLPLPPHRVDLLVPFDDFRPAIRTVAAIITGKKIVPVVMEFMARAGVKACEAFLGREVPFSDAAAQLIIGLAGTGKAEVERQYETVAEICLEMGAADVLVAETPSAKERLWEARRVLLETLKAQSPGGEVEDVVAPRSRIPELGEAVAEISARTGFKMVQWGHAGDGNVHIAIMKMEMPDRVWEEGLPKVAEEIFRVAIGLGGSITGEHGIGYVKRRFITMALGAAEIRAMKRLKEALDPKGILNPGKIFPE
ncbi:MAG: FAD-binding protein [Firmicutes bacterium]|nr:FAD-binding protein [Bacillota bacterium]